MFNVCFVFCILLDTWISFGITKVSICLSEGEVPQVQADLSRPILVIIQQHTVHSVKHDVYTMYMSLILFLTVCIIVFIFTIIIVY